MLVKNAKPLKLFFVKLRSRWRVLLGFCPMCNSDAPAVYNCPLCEGWQTTTNGMPDSETRKTWLSNHYQVLNSMVRTRLLVLEAQKNAKENS